MILATLVALSEKLPLLSVSASGESMSLCLWMKSYGELVNNTKLMVDAYQDKEINEDKIEEIDVQNEENNTPEESNENLIEFEEETF